MPEEYKLPIVILFILLVFAPVTLNAIRRRRLKPPPMAKNDRKLYRLWRSDPEAYERQYGAMDREYIAAQKRKAEERQARKRRDDLGGHDDCDGDSDGGDGGDGGD